jgi:Alpha/beta hydrolase domain
MSDPIFRASSWKFLTEWDVSGANEANVRQPDAPLFRTWKVAGTSHVDKHFRASREPLELPDNGVSSDALLEDACRSGTLVGREVVAPS